MFNLETRHWYGWQMMPGYTSDGFVPYFSPILVHEVSPLKTGKGVVRIAFANALYAQGVQNFVVDLKVFTRAKDYMVCELIESSNANSTRCAVVSNIDLEWLRRCCPTLIGACPPERYSGPASTVATSYLNEVFGGGAL